MFLKFCSKNSKFSKNDIFSKSFGKFVRSVKNCRFSSSLEQSYIVRFFSFLLKKLTFLISLNNPIRSSFVRRFFFWKTSYSTKNFVRSQECCSFKKQSDPEEECVLRSRLAMKWFIIGRFSNSRYRNIKWNKKVPVDSQSNCCLSYRSLLTHWNAKKLSFPRSFAQICNCNRLSN